MYLVLLGCTAFEQRNDVGKMRLMGSSLGFRRLTELNSVELSICGFYLVLPSLSGLYRRNWNFAVLLRGFLEFVQVLRSFTEYFLVLAGFTGFYWGLRGFT